MRQKLPSGACGGREASIRRVHCTLCYSAVTRSRREARVFTSAHQRAHRAQSRRRSVAHRIWGPESRDAQARRLSPNGAGVAEIGARRRQSELRTRVLRLAAMGGDAPHAAGCRTSEWMPVSALRLEWRRIPNRRDRGRTLFRGGGYCRVRRHGCAERG
jgi:hypothetical protein